MSAANQLLNIAVFLVFFCITVYILFSIVLGVIRK